MATEAQLAAAARMREGKAAKAVKPGQAVRVLIPKSRDPVQRTVTALVSEDDGDGYILAWCIPGRSSSDFTVRVGHRSLVSDRAEGWWEAVA